MSTAPFSHPLRVAHLNPRKPTELTLSPDAAARDRIAADLGLERLPQARLDLRIAAAGNDAWELTGRLTARVVQPCVITLAPVDTAIDEPVRRIYSPHAAQPDPDTTGAGIEMPDDETEPLGQTIDAGAVLVEALALALPLYPRAPGAELPQENAADDAADGDTRRPFADLAALLRARDGN